MNQVLMKKNNSLDHPSKTRHSRSVCLPRVCVSSLRDYVQYWAERGVEVVGWTVNSAVEKSFYQNLLRIGYITDSLLEDCDSHY